MDLSWWSMAKGPRPPKNYSKQIYWQTSQGLNSQDPELLSGSKQMSGPRWHDGGWDPRWTEGSVVNRVTMKKEGKVIPTNTLFLTFGSPELPKEITVGYLKVKVALFVSNPMRCFNCNKFGHIRANVAKLLQSVQVVEKISVKVSVRNPSCALIAMVPTLHWLKIARSGRRRRRINVSVLRNTYPFRKPDSWLKPRCQLWSLEVRPKSLLLPPEENPNLFSVKPR